MSQWIGEPVDDATGIKLISNRSAETVFDKYFIGFIDVVMAYAGALMYASQAATSVIVFDLIVQRFELPADNVATDVELTV